MRRFVIFFEGKEGTSAIVRLLDNFEQISVLHQAPEGGWEPFDAHHVPAMPLGDLRSCLEMVLGPEPVDGPALNQIYTRTAARPLTIPGPGTSVGVKMRFRPPRGPSRSRIRVLRTLASSRRRARFQRMLTDLFADLGVVVFIAFRRDVLRWALSRYHGDGTGKTGHLQFKLASGEITREDIAPIRVDCDRLGRIITSCERSHHRKRALRDDFRSAGVDSHLLVYEDFLDSGPGFFRNTLAHLDLAVGDDEIGAALAQGAFFEKVHSDDIAEFVENYEEVLTRFASG